MDWEVPDFVVVETSAEMTAYAGHWTDHDEDEVGDEGEADDDVS
jgi:hypothetical protein